MSRSARAAKGFAAGIIQFCAQTLVQVLLAPVVLKFAGRETLGAYAAIMQALGLLSLVDIAGSWSLERFLAQATGLDDNGSRFRVVLTTSRTLYWIIYGVFAILVLIFSCFIGPIFHLSPAISREARHALYVIALWSVVRVPLIAYSNALTAVQDIAIVNMISALGSILRTVASLGYVLAGGGLFGLMLAGTTAEAVSLVLYRIRFQRHHPDLSPGWGLPDKALLREMLGFGGHAGIVNIGNLLVFSSANTVAGITNGAAAASTYYTSQMPSMMAAGTLGRLNESTVPALNELYGRGEIERVRQAFSRITRMQLLFGFPLGLGVLLYNHDLVVTWVGPDQYAGFLLTASLAVYCLINGLVGIAIRFAFVFGWMRVLASTSILQGLANFGLGLLLGRSIGLGGIALALATVLLPQLVLLLFMIGRFLSLNVGHLLAGCAVRAVIPLIIASFVGLFVHSVVHVRLHHFGAFLEETLPFVACYFPLAYLFYMQPRDRSDAKRFFLAAISRGHAWRVTFSRRFGSL